MEKLLSLVMAMCAITLSAQQEDPQQYGVHGDDVPTGLAVGQSAPAIELKDHEGREFHLNKTLKEGPVVITFYRGNWCPYCTRFLAELSTYAGDIEELGASIVAISPERESQLLISGQETHPNIRLLSDYNGEVMRLYDVDFKVTNEYQQRLDKNMGVQLNDHNNQEVAELPVAATYIINKDGQIVYRHFNLNYKERAPIDEILEALREL